jgi:hypothetical protein
VSYNNDVNVVWESDVIGKGGATWLH